MTLSLVAEKGVSGMSRDVLFGTLISHRFFEGMRQRDVVQCVSKECCLTARKVSYLIWD